MPGHRQFCPQGHDTHVTGRYDYGSGGRCKVCHRAYTAATKRQVRAAPGYRAQQTAKRQAQKAELVALMGGKCVECGYDGPQEALDFDHRDPTGKTLDIAAALSRATAFERIKAEVLAKCQLLCANCHRIKTFAP